MDENSVRDLVRLIDQTRGPVDEGDALAMQVISEVEAASDTSGPAQSAELWETDFVQDWSGQLTEGPGLMEFVSPVLNVSASGMASAGANLATKIFSTMANKGITPERLGIGGLARIVNFVGNKSTGIVPQTKTPPVLRSSPRNSPAPRVRPRIIVPKDTPPPPPNIIQRRRDGVNRWVDKYGEKCVVQDGEYYSTGYVRMFGAGDNMLFVNKNDSFDFFTLYEGGQQTILGTVHNVDRADTNLSRPGDDSYLKQTFLIEQVRLRFKSIFVRYSSDIVLASGLPARHKDVLLGKMPVFDEAGLALPTTFFRDNDGHCDLLRSLAAVGSLNFEFKNTDAGTNSIQRNFLVDSLSELGITGLETGTAKRTSGGSSLPWLEDAYLWDLDRNNGGTFAFRPYVSIGRDCAFAYAYPDPLGTGDAFPIEECWVGIELKTRGTTIRPESEVRRFLENKGY